MKAGGPVLVTGATGFLGSHLSRALVAEACDVHIIVRPKSDLSPLDSITAEITVHVHDGSSEDMAWIVDEVCPEAVFHLASEYRASHAVEDIESLIRSNLLFGTQLLDACVRSTSPCLVNAGTAWQHYRNAEYDPVNLYAATKDAFERILLFYVNVHGLRATTLKLFDTYGPSDTRGKLVTHLLRAAETGETLEMSPGEQRLDFVHVEDVIRAFRRAGELTCRGERSSCREFGVYTGRPVSLQDLVGILREVTGRDIDVNWGARRYRDRQVMDPPTRISTVPNWDAQISLEEGLKDLWLKRTANDEE